MNDLFSGSFSRYRSDADTSPAAPSSPDHQHVIQMSESQTASAGVNLNKFFDDVESIKDDLKDLEKLNSSLHSSHEHSKTVHQAKSVKDLRAKMDADVSTALKKAKLIKVRLESLDRSNAANRSLPGCGPGSSSDRTRTSVVNGLRKKLKDSMESFTALREKISSEYRETVERRFFTVTGENPDEKTLDRLISTGESETFLQKAIQEQGRGRVLDTINEIQERHDAVKDMEKNLKELHQVFLDMAVLVQAQGEQLDDIESNMQRASSFVRGGTQQLQTARVLQKNTRKWTCYAITILLVIILFVVLFTVRPWENNNGGGGGGGNQPAPVQNPPAQISQPPPPGV
ncbi:SYP121 [Linum perenne]